MLNARALDDLSRSAMRSVLFEKNFLTFIMG